MKAPKFEKNAKYVFYEDSYTVYEFIGETKDGAKFTEYRLEPSDGSLEEIGEVIFDDYQVTRLSRLADAEE